LSQACVFSKLINDSHGVYLLAGNHDLSLDQALLPQGSQVPSRSISLFTSSRSITYLWYESAAIRLQNPKAQGPSLRYLALLTALATAPGPSATVEPETSPASKSPRPAASEIWRDVLVTHTPARTHCDAGPTNKQPFRCEGLRLTLRRVRPRLHVCGHIHRERVSERLRWRIDSSDSPTVEPLLDPSPDPKSGKMSLVDLTSRGGNLLPELGTIRDPVATFTAPR